MITVRNRGKGWEGSYQLPGSTTARLTRKDGTTTFGNRTALNLSARKFAKNVGMQIDFIDTTVKKAAKKSIKAKK